VERARSLSLSVSLKYWLACLGLAPLWLVLIGFVGPMAIRALHAGRGPAVLVAVLGGRAQLPAEHYVHAWWHYARTATFLLILLVLVGYVAVRLWAGIGRTGAGAASIPGGSGAVVERARESGDGRGTGGPMSQPEAPGGAPGGQHASPRVPTAEESPADGRRWTEEQGEPPGVSRLTPVLLGIWFGLLGGLGEGVFVFLRIRLLLEPVVGFETAAPFAGWTAPLGLAATFAAIGFGLGTLRIPRREIPVVAVATAVFAGLLVLGWMQLPGRVGTVSSVLLALGVALQAGRLVQPRAEVFVRYVRGSIPRGLALMAVLAGVQLTAGPLLGRWRLSQMPEAPPSPNVLLIVLDTERADRLSLYGHARPTPGLERIARSSVTFDRAFSPSSWTFPAHASLFTGQLHAGERLGDRSRSPLDERETTLAEVLRDAGYHTSAFSANMLFATSSLGLGQGFLEWSGLRLTPQNVWLSGWLNRWALRRYRSLTGGYSSLFRRSAADINGEFLGWLDRRPADRPFFTFINYFDAHSPYEAPAPYFGRYHRGRGPLWLQHGEEAAAYTAEERTRLSDAYDEAIAYLDAELEKLFDALGTRGLLENTLILITSDHGEQFGEHGFMLHGQNLHTTLTHVPLVIRLPEGERGGTRVATETGTLDLAATILDLTGVRSTAIGGRSLAPLLKGEVLLPEPVYSYQDGGRPERAVLHRGYHYIERELGPAALYHLPDDPAEANNIIAAVPPVLLAGLRARLEIAFSEDPAGVRRMAGLRPSSGAGPSTLAH
jgi:arylsulfatase A-like enzyme